MIKIRSAPWAVLLSLVVLSMGSLAPSWAQSPQEQLVKLVEELRMKPDDKALREQIIKLAKEVNSPPAVPESARQHFVEGTTLTKSAKDAAGQKLAVESFQAAVNAAPWWGDAYYNLAVAQELAGQFDGAQNSLRFYMLTNPGEKEAREAQDKIYALNAKKKLAEAEAAQKKAERRAAEDSPEARLKRFLESLEGAVFSSTYTLPGDRSVGRRESYYRTNIIGRNRQLIVVQSFWYRGEYEPNLYQGEESGRVELTGRTLTYNSLGGLGAVGKECNPMTLRISDNGSRLTRSYTCLGRAHTDDFIRVN